MRFAEPHLLWTLAAVPAMAFVALGLASWRRRALSRLGSLPTLSRLSSAPGAEWRGFRMALLLLGVGALSLALARPQWGTRVAEVRRKGVDLVMVVDVSRSMLAEDLRPSRLQRAREALGDLLDRLPGERAGLVAFSGTAQILCPLTLDHAAARIFLDIMDTSLIPEPGTALGTALEVGRSLFEPGERKYKVMVLFTDGEDHDTGPVDEARKAAEEGVVLYAVGMGTSAGEPIPIRDEAGRVVNYVRDDQDQVVTSRLDADTLEEMARATGGAYFPSTPGGQELDRIAEAILALDRKELSSRLAAHREDRFPIPLSVALLALAADAFVSDRRRMAWHRP